MEIFNITSDDNTQERPHCVLILDDDAATLRMLEAALTRRSYDVRTASTTEEARKLVDSGGIDIVLSDINLDGQSGLEFAKEVQALPLHPAVILMTGYYTEDSILEAFDSGVAGYIRKPIDLPQLYRTLATTVDDHLSAQGGVLNIEVGSLWETAQEFIESIKGLADLPEINCSRWLTFEAASSTVFVDRFGAVCRLFLARGADGDILDELNTAISEIGTNAIEWGNDFDDKRLVRLAAGLSGGSVIVIVEDSGAGFIPDTVPNPVTNAHEVMQARTAEGKRPGGFGISIVRAITDHLIYNERGNIVLIQKSLRSRTPRG